MNSGEDRDMQRHWNGVQIVGPKPDDLKFIRRDDPECEEDDLAAARGLVHGCLASLMLWAVILVAMWLVTR